MFRIKKIWCREWRRLDKWLNSAHWYSFFSKNLIFPWPGVYLISYIIFQFIYDTSILNLNPAWVLFEILHIRNRCLDPIPNGHEGKTKEEAKGSPKLSKPGLKRIYQGLDLDKGVLGHRPEAKGYRILCRFYSIDCGVLLPICVDKAILLVSTRTQTTSHLHNVGHVCIVKCMVQFLKTPEWMNTDEVILLLCAHVFSHKFYRLVYIF